MCILQAWNFKCVLFFSLLTKPWKHILTSLSVLYLFSLRLKHYVPRHHEHFPTRNSLPSVHHGGTQEEADWAPTLCQGLALIRPGPSVSKILSSLYIYRQDRYTQHRGGDTQRKGIIYSKMPMFNFVTIGTKINIKYFRIGVLLDHMTSQGGRFSSEIECLPR